MRKLAVVVLFLNVIFLVSIVVFIFVGRSRPHFDAGGIPTTVTYPEVVLYSDGIICPVMPRKDRDYDVLRDLVLCPDPLPYPKNVIGYKSTGNYCDYKSGGEIWNCVVIRFPDEPHFSECRIWTVLISDELWVFMKCGKNNFGEFMLGEAIFD